MGCRLLRQYEKDDSRTTPSLAVSRAVTKNQHTRPAMGVRLAQRDCQIGASALWPKS
jgi:hypothetical protein